MDKSSIRLVFQFNKKDDEISVVMIKLEHGEWYIFPHDKRSINQHPLLDTLIRSIRWDENGMGIGYYDLPANLKDVYFNVKSNEFKFKNRTLILGRQTVSGVCLDYFNLPQNKPGKRKISETLDDSFNSRKCKPSIHQQSSTGNHQSSDESEDFIDDSKQKNLVNNTQSTTSTEVKNQKNSNCKPKISRSNITFTEDDEKIKYDIDFLFVGSHRFISRSYFQIDAQNFTLFIKPRSECIKINLKLITNILICEHTHKQTKNTHIRINFSGEAVEAMNNYLRLYETNGVFKYKSINSREKYFLMKVRHLGEDEALKLKKRFKMYFRNRCQEDKGVYKLVEEQRAYLHRVASELSI